MKNIGLQRRALYAAVALAFAASYAGAAYPNATPVLQEVTNLRVAADPLNLQAFVSETATFDALASDPDVGDVLAYSAPILLNPFGTSVSLSALGVTISNTTDTAGRRIGRVAISPDSSDLGVWQLRIRVDDGRGGADEHHLFVSVGTFANRSPVFLAPPPAELFVAEGGSVSFALAASDPDAGQSVTLRSSGRPAGSVFGEASTGNPVSATFDWTPAPGEAGDYRILFEAIDNGSPSISEAVATIIHVQQATVVPEPSSVLLIAAGLIGIALLRALQCGGTSAGALRRRLGADLRAHPRRPRAARLRRAVAADPLVAAGEFTSNPIWLFRTNLARPVRRSE
jgi:hypothetical protein